MDPSQYCTFVESVPCSTDAREAQKNLRAICKPDNDYSFPQKCEILERVGRQTFNLPQTKMSFRSRMTILFMLHKIIMMPGWGADTINTLSRVEEFTSQIAYIRGWYEIIGESVGSEPLPNTVKYFYTTLLIHKTFHIGVMHQSLIHELVTLRDTSSTIHPRPTFLKDDESLNQCPGLKDKVASSIKTVTEQATHDICTICLERKPSTQKNFAILDNCVHLFCRICIKIWFTLA